MQNTAGETVGWPPPKPKHLPYTAEVLRIASDWKCSPAEVEERCSVDDILDIWDSRTWLWDIDTEPEV